MCGGGLCETNNTQVFTCVDTPWCGLGRLSLLFFLLKKIYVCVIINNKRVCTPSIVPLKFQCVCVCALWNVSVFPVCPAWPQ